MKNKKILFTLALFLSFWLTLAQAQTQYSLNDAESFYSSALTYFSQNDFRNSLRSAHLAKDIFTDFNSQLGVDKSSQLISQIDGILNDAQMASAYYDIAGNYFLQDSPTVWTYTKAKEFAEYAKTYYNRAGDSEGVFKSDDLITRAQREISDIRNQRQQEAYTYYNMAKTSFFSEEYIKARNYAMNASAIYSEIMDSAGVSQTASLLVSIDGKINETTYNALASYDRALDYYSLKDYESALRYASTSQQLYTKVENLEGINKATSLVSRINTESGQAKEQKLRDAQNYYDQAEEMLIIGDFINATDYAGKARVIYMEFYSKAFEDEKNLPYNQQVNTKLYSGYVAGVDDLISRINGEWGSEKKKQQAELFYTRAQEYYIQSELESALNYAERAKSYFTDLNDYIGANKCDSLVVSIRNRMTDKRQADTYYDQALGFYRTADFESALLYAGKARNLYVKILDTSSTAKTDNLTLDINNGVRIRDEANAYQEQAANYFNIGNYDNAKSYSQRSYGLYLQINYTLGAVNAEQIINQSSSRIEESYMKFRNNALIAVAVILVGGYVILSRLRVEKSVEKEIKKEKDKINEEKMEREREWAIRREQETREKVESELKRLIEQEREMSGGSVGGQDAGRKK